MAQTSGQRAGQTLFRGLGEILAGAPQVIQQARQEQQTQQIQQFQFELQKMQFEQQQRVRQANVLKLMSATRVNNLEFQKLQSALTPEEQGELDVKITTAKAAGQATAKLGVQTQFALSPEAQQISAAFPEREVSIGGVTIGKPPGAKLTTSDRLLNAFGIDKFARFQKGIGEFAGVTKVKEDGTIDTQKTIEARTFIAANAIWQGVSDEIKNKVGVGVIDTKADLDKVIRNLSAEEPGGVSNLFGLLGGPVIGKEIGDSLRELSENSARASRLSLLSVDELTPDDLVFLDEHPELLPSGE